MIARGKQDHPAVLYLQGLVHLHKKELYKARAVLNESMRREECYTGIPLPSTLSYLSLIYKQLNDLPAALHYAQREVALLASSPVVPQSVRLEAEARVAKLNSECPP